MSPLDFLQITVRLILSPKRTSTLYQEWITVIVKAKYITKCGLLKGHWVLPLTERTKEISPFVSPDGFYQYHIMTWNEEFPRIILKTHEPLS